MDTILYYKCGYRKGVYLMSPRLGRPTTDPKVLNTRVRLSEEDTEMLEYCAEKTGKTKSEIIRQGIRLVYNSVASEEVEK